MNFGLQSPKSLFHFTHTPMKRMLFMLLLGLFSLVGLRPAHAQAPRFWPRKALPAAAATRSTHTALVATPSFPIAAPARVAAAESAPAASASAAGAGQAYPTVPSVGYPSAHVAAAVVAPPSYADSLARAGSTVTITGPTRPLRPDPGRHRKGYNYR